ncbi:MAG: hypothetical protein R3B90_12370 [Planctomycetaceae bacterium]
MTTIDTQSSFARFASTGGDVSITASQNVIIGSATTVAGQAVTLFSSGGDISLTSHDGSVEATTLTTTGGPGTTASTGGNVGVMADLNVTLANVTTDGGSSVNGTSAAGTVQVMAGDELEVTGSILARGGAVTNAAGGVGGEVQLQSMGGGIIVNDINTSGGSGVANGGAAGNIDITNAGSGAGVTLNGTLTSLGGRHGAGQRRCGRHRLDRLGQRSTTMTTPRSTSSPVNCRSSQRAASRVQEEPTRLEIDVDEFAATTSTGSVAVVDTDASGLARLAGLTITTVSTDVKGTLTTTTGVSVTDAGGGFIDIEAAGANAGLVVLEQVANAGTDTGTIGTGDTIRLAASGSNTTGIDLQSANADVTATGGDIVIDANTGNLNMVAGSSIESDGAGHNITISTDNATLATGASISSVGGTVTIAADSFARNINIGGGGAEVDTDANSIGASSLNLNDAELDVIAAAQVNIGTASLFTPFGGPTIGTITVTGGISATANFATTEFQLLTSTDVAINSRVNLDANLAGAFDVLAGRDITQTGANADVTTAGDGFVQYTAARLIAMNANTSITTINGDVTLFANDGPTNFGGNFTGITLTDADISTGNALNPGGDILLRGTGGNAGSNNIGVLLQSSASISSQGSGATAGTVTIEGFGGAANGSGNIGVSLDGANTLVTSVDGDIVMEGIGGAGGNSFNRGVSITNSAAVSSTGLTADAATISIDGTAADGTSSNVGVILFNAARVVSTAGAIELTGQGGDDLFDTPGGTFNNGIALQVGSVVESLGTATVTLNGIAGNGTDSNFGVWIVDAGSRVSSAGGDIAILGNVNAPGAGPSATGTQNIGVSIQLGAQVTATGTANIVIEGEGADGVNNSFGVRIRDANTLVSAEDGDIEIIGRGGNGTGVLNHGVAILASGTVRSTGAGSIEIDGTSTTNSGATGNGVNIATNAIVEVATGGTGAIEITGRDGVGGDDAAVVIDGATVSTDTTQITITGVNQNVEMQGTAIVRSNSGGALIQASNNVLLTVVNLDFDAAGTQGTAIITADANTTAFTGGEASNCIGQIIDNELTVGDAVLNIIAQSAVLRAGTGIGNFSYGTPSSEANDINVEVTTLAAFTCSGDIFVTDPTALIVDELDGLTNGLETQLGTGDILVRAGTSLTVDGHVLHNAEGSVTLAAGIGAASGTLDVNANITVDSGDARLIAFDGLNVNGTSAINVSGGDAELHAGRIFNFDETLAAAAANADVTLASDTLLTTNGGDAILSATGDVLLGRVNSNDRATAAGTVYVIADSDGSGAGAIIDNRSGDGGGNENVTALNLSLRAATGIGANDAIDTNIETLAATNSEGDIKIDDVTGLTIGSIAGRLFSLELTDASVGETGAGEVAGLVGVTLTDGLLDDGGDDIALQASGAISVATGSSIQNLDAGDITLDANAGGVSLQGGVASSSNGGVATGTVRISATDSVTQTTAGVISAEALGVNTTAGAVNLLAATNDVDTLAVNTAGGDIGFRDADGFHLDQVAAQNNTMFDTPALFAETNGLNAGTGSVRLVVVGTGTSTAENSITQDGTNGAITAGSLGVRLTGGDLLLDPNAGMPAINDVDIFSANVVEAGGLGGNVEFSDVDDLTVASVTTLGTFTGTVGVVADNDVLICVGESLDLQETVTAGDTARLQAATDITQGLSGEILAMSLGLRAGGAIMLTAADNNVDILAADATSLAFRDVDGLSIGSVSGRGCFAAVTGVAVDDLTLCVDNGDLEIDAAIGAASTVRLQVGGDVTQTAAITAVALGINATGSVTLTNAANDVDILAITTIGGIVDFNDSDDLTIDTVTGNDCFVEATGIVTANGAVTVTTGGDLTIDDATTTNVGRIDAGAGTVTLDVGGGLIDGSATLSGDSLTDIIGGAVTITTQSGVGSDSGLLTDTGDIEINATTLTVDNQSSGNVQISEVNNVAVGSITNVSRLVVLQASGRITDATVADGTANITAAALAVAAGTGIGTAASDFDVDVDTLSAAVNTGGVFIESDGEVTIASVGGQAGVGVASGAAAIELAATNGSLNIAQPITHGGSGDILLTATGVGSDITTGVNGAITANGGGITLIAAENVATNAAVSTVGSGAVSVTAGADITTNAGTTSGSGGVTLDAGADIITNGAVTAVNGDVNFNAVASIDINAAIDSSAGGNVNLVAGTDISIDGDVTTGGGSVNATAGGLLATTESIATAGGDVGLVAGDDITIGGLIDSANGSVTLDSGSDILTNAAITSGTGNVAFTAVDNITTNASIITTSGDVIFDAGMNIQTNSTVTSGGGVITMSADQDVTIGDTINSAPGGAVSITAAGDISLEAGLLTDGGAVTLEADGEVTMLAAGDITTQGGAVAVTADADSSGAGEIIMLDGAVTDAGTGTVTFRAGGNIVVGSIMSTNAGNAITLVSTLGGIIDGGDSQTDLVATSATAIVSLTAASGVGFGNALETNIERLETLVTTTGDVGVSEQDGIELVDVETADGAVTVAAGGTITVTRVDTSGTDDGSNDVRLTTTGSGSDIVITSLVAGAQNDVILTSADDVLNTASAAAASVIADDLVITAANNVADAVAAIDLLTQINDLTATVTGGNRGDIVIVEVDSLNLATSDAATDTEVVRTSNGQIDITTGGSLTVVDTTGGNDGANRTGDVEVIAGGPVGMVTFTVGANFELQTNAQIDVTNAALNATPAAPDTITQDSPAANHTVPAAGDPNPDVVVIAAQGNVQWGAEAQVRTLDAAGNVIAVARQIAIRPLNDGLTITGSEAAFYNAATAEAPTLIREGNEFVAELTVTIGQPGERGLFILIDWGTDAADRFERIEGLVGGETYTFVHRYTEVEVLNSRIRRGSSSDPISVQFGVGQEGSILLLGRSVTPAGGGAAEIPDPTATGGLAILSQTDLASTTPPFGSPGTDGTFVENGGGDFLIPSLEIGLPITLEEREFVVIEAEPIEVTSEVVVTEARVTADRIQRSSFAAIGRDEYLELRVLSADPDALPLAVRRLPDDFLAGREGASFVDLFDGLPDGTYEIWYVLGSSRKLLVRVQVRNGESIVQDDAFEGGTLKLEEIVDELRQELGQTSQDVTHLRPTSPVPASPVPWNPVSFTSTVDGLEANADVSRTTAEILRQVAMRDATIAQADRESGDAPHQQQQRTDELQRGDDHAPTADSTRQQMRHEASGESADDEQLMASDSVDPRSASAMVPALAAMGVDGVRRLRKRLAIGGQPFSRSRRAAMKISGASRANMSEES